MLDVVRYLREFFRDIHKGVLVATTLLTTFLIWCSYERGLHDEMNRNTDFNTLFARYYLLYFVASALPFCFCLLLAGKNYFRSPLFLFLLVVSPAIFTWKYLFQKEWKISKDPALDVFWNYILQWPVNLVGLVLALLLVWALFYRKESFFGATTRKFKWKPYFWMLMLMIPLVAAASTQRDFLWMYPRMEELSPKLTHVSPKWPYQLAFELAYGSNFISIEMFFRGFLVLAFGRIAGKDAILPAACFYCTIHFGKPLGECISSYFGGIFLGVVVYHTRSIIGGLMVHLGIAWLMELGGYVGRWAFLE